VERPIPGPDVITIDPAEDGYQFLLQNINEAMAAGAFRPELTDPEMIAQLFWAGVHGVATIHLSKPHGSPVHPWIDMKHPDETVSLMVDVLCRGVLRHVGN